ncbi:DNA repair protein RAD57 [Biscogniauxia mediterranea]|nr:DNA repair protein RAD57 [Biscogniauxia mediterranea]
MTDLSRILPDFPIAQYAHLLPAIEKHHLSTTDLLTLDVTDIGKRTQLPLLDIKRLCNAVLRALHVDLGVLEAQDDVKRPHPRDPAKASSGLRPGTRPSALRHTGAELIAKPWRAISTLDASLDAALGGGVPAGYVTEIVGESGAGKTQFLLTLLLSVQLPPPHGLGRPALYISTEAPLSTRRLSQILANHPFFQDESESKPTLDGIVSTVTPDLESQDHILTYQVPVEVERRNIGLIVLDSVAANYRAEFERGAKGGGSSSGSNMAARSNELVRLGQLLRDLARKHDLAVVVANQVADRFSPPHAHHLNTPTPAFFPRSSSSAAQPHKPYYHLHLGGASSSSQESPLASRSRNAVPPNNLNLSSQPEPQPPTSSSNNNDMADIVVKSSMPPPDDDPLLAPHSHPALLLDHQQRWFTGWGDDPYESGEGGVLKTPSLGLVWSTQIASRVALFRRPVYNNHNNYGGGEEEDDGDGVGDGMASARATASWRRWMKVVFAPHVPGSGSGLDGAVEFEVTMGGIKGVDRAGKGRGKGKQKG